jgi:hypothetical protein
VISSTSNKRNGKPYIVLFEEWQNTNQYEKHIFPIPFIDLTEFILSSLNIGIKNHSEIRKINLR